MTRTKSALRGRQPKRAMQSTAPAIKKRQTTTTGHMANIGHIASIAQATASPAHLPG